MVLPPKLSFDQPLPIADMRQAAVTSIGVQERTSVGWRRTGNSGGRFDRWRLVWGAYLGKLEPFGKESTMSRDARNEDLELTAEEKEKFSELVAFLARHGFGAAGPPRETTFAQIERFGHQAGRMVARAIDARLALAA